MATNIYVGNLAFSTTSADLETLFAAHGEVAKAQVVTDRETGRSRGFGFIEMPNDAEAAAAIKAVDGKSVDGRQLKVNVAKDRRA
jgi:RNA recognition motif-containing protein